MRSLPPTSPLRPAAGLVRAGAAAQVLRTSTPIVNARPIPTTVSFRARLFPILFFQAYLLASVIIFAIGPVNFEIYNPLKLYSYVLAGQAAMLIGYWIGAAQPARGYGGPLSRRFLFTLTIIITLALLPATLLQRNHANISLTEALLNPGAAYAARAQELQDREAAPLISVVRVAAAPLLGLFVPLGILFGPRQGAGWRYLWWLGLVGVVAEPVFTGAAKGIFDLVLVVPWLVWIRMQRQSPPPHHALPPPSQRVCRPPRPARRKRSRWMPLVVTTAAVVVVALAYFSYSRQSRYGMTGNEFPSGTTGWSTDLYGVYLPPSIEYPAYMMSRYLSQGYLGLSECLELPFQWSYGIGHSTFWMRYAGVLSSDPDYFLMRSYPYRLEIETGYSVAYYWHTIYPWLASDLTFPGAIMFVALLGYLLARAWTDTLVGANPFAAGFLVQILLMFFYIPANNGRLMFSEEAMMFWGLLTLWLLTRSRLRPAGALP